MSRSNSNGPYSGAARSAREFFAFQYPGMLLKLPLRPQERFWLKSMKEGALGYILAFYAESLEAYNYRYFSHANFDDYACGLMACSTVPEEIRNDPEMLRRFPPKRLEGLDETTLCWREVRTESAKIGRDIGAPLTPSGPQRRSGGLTWTGRRKRMVSIPKKARGARFLFKHFRPDGAAPLLEGAPPLPLLPEDRFWLMSMKEGPLGYVTACYAASLEGFGYDVYAHPMPEEYVRGLMACSTVPAEVRNDPEMLRRFPPKKLEGLDETTLCWRTCDNTEAA